MAPQLLTKALLVATAAGATTVLLYVCVQTIRRAIKKSSGIVRGKVTALYVYPIKSCGGIEVTSRAVEARGFVCDRLWMLIDGSSNTFLTQRQVPAMAKIRPSLPDDYDQPLEVNAPGMPKLVVPVKKEGSVCVVRVWDDWVEGVDQGDEAAQWFAQCLHKENVRLLRFRDCCRREVEVQYAGRGHRTGFSDGYPFLLASEASLANLNSRLPQPIPMNRFRPNIVVGGCDAWEEDVWREVSIGGLPMRVVKPCSRCKMPTIDQETGESSDEPTKTLKTFRTGETLGLRNPKWKSEWFFAQNLVHDCSSGTLHVGDELLMYD